jgi:hypothetical protein
MDGFQQHNSLVGHQAGFAAFTVYSYSILLFADCHTEKYGITLSALPSFYNIQKGQQAATRKVSTPSSPRFFLLLRRRSSNWEVGFFCSRKRLDIGHWSIVEEELLYFLTHLLLLYYDVHTSRSEKKLFKLKEKAGLIAK